MLILFNHGTPKGLARALPGHTIVTAHAKGWHKLNDGALLSAAEEAVVDLLLTTPELDWAKNRHCCVDRCHEMVTCTIKLRTNSGRSERGHARQGHRIKTPQLNNTLAR